MLITFPGFANKKLNILAAHSIKLLNGGTANAQIKILYQDGTEQTFGVPSLSIVNFTNTLVAASLVQLSTTSFVSLQNCRQVILSQPPASNQNMATVYLFGGRQINYFGTDYTAIAAGTGAINPIVSTDEIGASVITDPKNLVFVNDTTEQDLNTIWSVDRHQPDTGDVTIIPTPESIPTGFTIPNVVLAEDQDYTFSEITYAGAGSAPGDYVIVFGFYLGANLQFTRSQTVTVAAP